MMDINRMTPESECYNEGDLKPRAQSISPHNPQQLAHLTSSEFPFVLPIPAADDGLEATAAKLRALADAISGGGGGLSLTNGPKPISHWQEIESFAKERMLEVEWHRYQEWKEEKIALPEVDWATSRIRVMPESANSFAHRAEAINIIYRCRGVEPENAAWVSNNIPRLVPLIKAVCKVLAARTHLEMHDPLFRLSEGEFAEAQTLHMITSSVEENMARERERVKYLTECINQSQEVLKARLKMLVK